jgi:hypothetical protein
VIDPWPKKLLALGHETRRREHRSGNVQRGENGERALNHRLVRVVECDGERAASRRV